MKIRELLAQMITNHTNIDEEAYITIVERNRRGEIIDRTAYPIDKYDGDADEIVIEIRAR